MASDRTIIEITDITKTYSLGEVDVPALRGLSLKIRQGEFISLMGVSGSGKTTLMNILGCLDRPTSGKYSLEGQEISCLSTARLAAVRGERIGFIFQSFNLLSRTSAIDNVSMPTSYESAQPSSRAVRARSVELLKTVGLADRMKHDPSQLSGGQQQRVAIARALVNDPVLLLADEPTGNLDSATSREILEMFRRLNAEHGITIVVVTHDAAVASYAHRVVRLADGRIQADEITEAGREASFAKPAAPARKRRKTTFRGPIARLRGLGSTITIGLKALRRNILRSFLTTLGIIIGIAAVIAMMEISKGASTAIERAISAMGANTILVLPGAVKSSGVTQETGSAKTLTPEDGEAISNECPSVQCVAPIVSAGSTQVVYGNRNWTPRYLVGTTPSFLDARDWKDLPYGEAFTDDDVSRGRRVCLIGHTVATELFGRESPVGKEIRVRDEPFKVLGLLSTKGASLTGRDQDDILIAPLTTIKHRLIGSRLATSTSGSSSARAAASSRRNDSNYPYHCSPPVLYPVASAHQVANTPQLIRMANVNQLLVQAVSAKKVPAAIEEIRSVLADRHRIPPGGEEDFRVRDLAEVSRALATAAGLLSGLLLSVAMISLVVGGVGIMNIMLVSVTERTREIGLRMAVGAGPKDILRQFLAECITLCLIGGFMGIIVGRGTSQLVRLLLEWPVEPSFVAAAVAVSVAVTVGLVFGYYPALKASRLDPIEALRYE